MVQYGSELRASKSHWLELRLTGRSGSSSAYRLWCEKVVLAHAADADVFC